MKNSLIILLRIPVWKDRWLHLLISYQYNIQISSINLISTKLVLIITTFWIVKLSSTIQFCFISRQKFVIKLEHEPDDPFPTSPSHPCRYWFVNFVYSRVTRNHDFLLFVALSQRELNRWSQFSEQKLRFFSKVKI